MNKHRAADSSVELSRCQLLWRDGKQVELPPCQLAPGETLGVMGPSGCGKSTWLRWLLGVQQDYVDVAGAIYFGSRRVDHLPIEERSTGMVMQDQSLFPHYSVADNLAFALRAQRLGRQQRQQVIAGQLDALGLAGYQQRLPQQLSGGEKARISLLRAVLARPQLILLDEPFNGLDAARRRQVCEWTYAFLREQRIAAIIVSHDAADLSGAQQRLQWPESGNRKDEE
ncbi:ATP-binding cassette domain-containing protein [Pseudidiomarina insulisalsae]|uniref:ABC transporter domain-containing protein n=1 Tax=Pseudidiomarina insulisalsae TaxID=575789 RepID=A0A432YGZ4_9GAMM|nr:ATP-binding cassette domain-containing protein [Pseudidiomarina insulisalsae]RUO60221.1 hypothetical protein CWI71_07365 [Pseudidiomarina insulisalsae]